MLTGHCRWLIGFLLIGLLAACASTPTNKPDDALTKAQYAISQAQQNGADKYAPLPLYKANQKLDAAKQLARKQSPSEEDYTRARRLAEEAAADAQFAQARAQAKQAQQQSKEAQESVQTLRQELNRKGAAQ